MNITRRLTDPTTPLWVRVTGSTLAVVGLMAVVVGVGVGIYTLFNFILVVGLAMAFSAYLAAAPFLGVIGIYQICRWIYQGWKRIQQGY